MTALVCSLLVPALALGAPTDLDPTFGTSGAVRTVFPQVSPNGSADAYRLAQAPDGKIVAVGERSTFATPTQRDWAVARYSANGALDTSFNPDAGLRTLPFSHTGPDPGSLGALAVAVQQFDSNILISGASDSPNLVVARLLGGATNPGNNDNTFGTMGVATLPIPTATSTVGRRIFVQPDGKIIVSGNYFAGDTGSGGDTRQHPFVARLNSDGSPDTTFAGGGVLTVASAKCDPIAASDCSSDGLAVTTTLTGGATAIYIGGTDLGATIGGRVFKFVPAVAGVPANYGLDPTWGPAPGGVVQIERHAVNFVNGLLLRADGSLVVAGVAQTEVPSFQCGAVRLTSSGALDPSFGTSGVGRLTIAGSNGDGTCAVNDLAQQTDGKLLITGLASDGNFGAGNTGIAIGRFTASGQPDTAFAPNGVLRAVAPAPGAPTVGGGGILLQGAKFVVAGGGGSPKQFLLARFNGGDIPGSTQTNTNTTLSTSASPALVGQHVTYTASVKPVPDGGSVTFRQGANTICAAVPVSAGKATCATSYTAPGSHSVLAIYSGDTAFTGSISAALTETVRRGTGMGLKVTSQNKNDPLHAVSGQRIVFTAIVSPAPNGGTVSFGIKGRGAFSACTKRPVDKKTGKAVCAVYLTTPTSGGPGLKIEAFYSGDATFAASKSRVVTEFVSAAGTFVGNLAFPATDKVTFTLGCKKYSNGCRISYRLVYIQVLKNGHASDIAISREQVKLVKADQQVDAGLTLNARGKKLLKQNKHLPVKLEVTQIYKTESFAGRKSRTARFLFEIDPISF